MDPGVDHQPNGTKQLQLETADTPDEAPHLRFGTTVIYPGKVGEEFFMTKGHFHAQERTPEVYFCLRGHGCFVMETREGEAVEADVNVSQAQLRSLEMQHDELQERLNRLARLRARYSNLVDEVNQRAEISRKATQALADARASATAAIVPGWLS